jgi:hypothetical protein
VNNTTIGPGDVTEFTTSESFEIEGTGPILVGQFIVGSNYPGIENSCIYNDPTLPCRDGCLFPLSCVTSLGYCGVACTRDSNCTSVFNPGLDVTCFEGFCAATGIGDPAFMLSVPINQYRDNYIFLTPADYREDWFTAIAPVGTVLTFDGTALPAGDLTPIGDTGYAVLYHSTANTGGADPAAAHTLTGTNPFALQVYGFDCDVSYAYPGGLNLETGDDE